MPDQQGVMDALVRSKPVWEPTGRTCNWLPAWQRSPGASEVLKKVSVWSMLVEEKCWD